MKRLLLLLVISVVSQIAVAQWRFTVSMSISGCGNSLEDKAAIKAAEAQVNYWMGQGFVTFHSKIECEQSRNFIISESYTNGNCKVRFIPTPCTGSGGASDVVDVMGISRGTSFNPTNVASEIQDWSEDDMQRMIVLNPDYNNIEPNQLSMGSKEIDQVRDQARKSAFILDTSKPFRSLNIGEDTGIITHSDDLLPLKEKPANMAIVNKYLDKIDIDNIPDWLKTNKVSGLNEDVPFQYQLAAFLGQKLPKDINMTFTGHSLGGVLASIAAAVSGKPAYTFNSEGVIEYENIMGEAENHEE